MRQPPGRDDALRPSPDNSAKGTTREQSQTRPKPNNTIHIVRRAQAIVDLAALLVLDVAAIASESGKAHHARAALHLRDATAAAWLASETLAEGACI